MNILIVSGGSINTEFLKNVLKDEFDCIIAVDKGLESLYQISKEPDIIVGDFDSVKKEVLENYKSKEIHKFDAEKDYTDTELAINIALSKNPKRITILGAIGTRVDHTLANIHILTLALNKQVYCEILDEHNKIYLVDKYFKIENAFGNYVSIIPLTSTVSGITLKGFKYPLDNYCLSYGKSLGISNEISEKISTIEVKSGILVVFETKDFI